MMHHDKQSYYVRVYSTKKGRATDEERYLKNVLKLAGVLMKYFKASTVPGYNYNPI